MKNDVLGFQFKVCHGQHKLSSKLASVGEKDMRKVLRRRVEFIQEKVCPLRCWLPADDEGL